MADSCRHSPTPGDYWKNTQEAFHAEVVADSLLPVIDAGLADLVAADHVIEDGVRLQHTPGHTPGHCSVLLGDGREEAIITGDLLHHPFQIAEPHRSSRACDDPVLAARTRREFVERYADSADSDTLVLGTHFAPPTAVRIASGPRTCRATF